jgi:hypothetical protein
MKTSTNVAIMLLAFLGVLTASTAAAEQPDAQPGPGVTVTIEVFSGRPNPAFVLDDLATVNGLRGAVSRIPAASPEYQEVSAFTHLGYRGIVIENTSGVEGIPRYMQVLDGLVLTRGENGGAPRYFRDTESLERRCLVLAVERGLIGDLIEAGLVPDPSTM